MVWVQSDAICSTRDSIFFLSVVNVRWYPKIGTTKMLGKDPQKIDGYLKSIEMFGVFWSEQAMKKTKKWFYNFVIAL